jgi:predicted DNA-binding transcriptional regulator YafY
MQAKERVKELNELFLRKTFMVTFAHVASYFKDVWDEVGYGERTFNRDIRELKEKLKERYPSLEDANGELIRYSRASQTYRYIRDDISAFPSFSEKELNQIASIIEFNKHLFTEGTGNGIVNKLRAISLENNLAQFHEVLPWSAIQLIKEGERSGSDQLKTLLACIYAKKIIAITHKGLEAEGPASVKRGLPLMIKEYNNGWYTGWYLLFYRVEEMAGVIRPRLEDCWIYALDRIESIQELGTAKIRIPEGFNPADFFKDVLGIFRNTHGSSPVQKVRLKLKISPEATWLCQYIQKYPIHDSQKIEELTVGLHMEINQELEGFLMRFANEIQVMEPAALRKKMQGRLAKALENYH